MFQGCLVHIGGINHSYICNDFEDVELYFASKWLFFYEPTQISGWQLSELATR